MVISMTVQETKFRFYKQKKI